jgi:hypothetical protein
VNNKYVVNNEYVLDPEQFPRRIELQLSDRLVVWLAQAVAATGRSPAELLMERLDQALHSSDGD